MLRKALVPAIMRDTHNDEFADSRGKHCNPRNVYTPNNRALQHMKKPHDALKGYGYGKKNL